MNSLTKENTRLGFIGIGNMGSRMAKRLLEHGYQVIVYNRSREAAEALAKFGTTVADSIAELASEADVILSSLTNDDAVKSVYTDPEGVLAHVRRGSAIVEMSTVLPATSRELYELAAEPKELILYHGCGHDLTECREEVERDLLDWLRRVMPS